jgi:hypothetical protein
LGRPPSTIRTHAVAGGFRRPLPARYIMLKHRFVRRVVPSVVALSLLIGIALLVLVWAANPATPPPPPSAASAVKALKILQSAQSQVGR